MRILVTTAGEEGYHKEQQQAFVHLADADAVGQHEHVDDPSAADGILFVDLHQHPMDPYLRVLRKHPLVRRWPEKVFVHDQRDQPFFTFPGLYVGAKPGGIRRWPVSGAPYPELATPLTPRSVVPELLFSFQGSRTHPCRESVLRLHHERALVEDTSSLAFYSADEDSSRDRLEQARARYALVVANSKFVLCPRGHGPSTFRLYETMSAGRVPVVLSDDWLPPPRVDWARCAVRVAERAVEDVPRLLESLEHCWTEMVTAGRQAFAEELGHDRLWHHYVTSLAELSHRRRVAPSPWWLQSQVFRLRARAVRAVLQQDAKR